MNATFIFLFGAIVALILAGVEYYRAKQVERYITEELTDKAESLDKTKASLDAYREELLNKEARLNMDSATPVRATYFTSESDLMKYSDDKKLAKAIKKALCIQLADSMMKIAEPHKVKLEDGREMYALHFRVKEEE